MNSDIKEFVMQVGDMWSVVCSGERPVLLEWPVLVTAAEFWRLCTRSAAKTVHV
jgi:hypothetical protein